MALCEALVECWRAVITKEVVQPGGGSGGKDAAWGRWWLSWCSQAGMSALRCDEEGWALAWSDSRRQVRMKRSALPLVPMRPGQAERRSRDCKRHGTFSLFAVLDMATGRIIGRCSPRHRTQEFLKFLRVIDAELPRDLDVHLVIDSTQPTRRRRSAPGSPGGRTGTSISPRARPLGSTRSSASSPR
jgi:hypothetical protein